MLPRIKLPTFSGKVEDWPAFRDLFGSIIAHDTSLSSVEKLHYLKTSLKDEAEKLMRNILSTAENYDQVWKTLTDHYENNRLLVRACLTEFLTLPRMKGESVTDLCRLYHVMLQTVGSLEGIGRPIRDCDLFVHLVIEMLDPRSRRDWEITVTGAFELPVYENVKIFLEDCLRTLEVLHTSNSEPGSSGAKNKARSHLTQRTAKNGKCSFCQKKHYILSCEKFQKKTPGIKRTFAESANLCFNCFGKHRVTSCLSKHSCAACKRRHHSSIHDVCAKNESDAVGTTTSLHTRNTRNKRTAVLLATARIMATERYGDQILVRALIDPGSEISLISESLVQRLRLPRSSAAITIYGVGGQQTGVARGKVLVDLASRVNDKKVRVFALILPRITTYGGRVGGGRGTWRH